MFGKFSKLGPVSLLPFLTSSGLVLSCLFTPGAYMLTFSLYQAFRWIPAFLNEVEEGSGREENLNLLRHQAMFPFGSGEAEARRHSGELEMWCRGQGFLLSCPLGRLEVQ